MTQKAMNLEKKRAIKITVTQSNNQDHWQLWLGRNVVEVLWAVPGNIPSLLSRITYYDNWRKNNIF
jgi:hypothetical protein